MCRADSAHGISVDAEDTPIKPGGMREQTLMKCWQDYRNFSAGDGARAVFEKKRQRLGWIGLHKQADLSFRRVLHCCPAFFRFFLFCFVTRPHYCMKLGLSRGTCCTYTGALPVLGLFSCPKRAWTQPGPLCSIRPAPGSGEAIQDVGIVAVCFSLVR